MPRAIASKIAVDLKQMQIDVSFKISIESPFVIISMFFNLFLEFNFFWMLDKNLGIMSVDVKGCYIDFLFLLVEGSFI